jgi:hypothetical protein
MRNLGELYGRVFQHGYVTNDLDAAIEWFRTTLGTGEFSRFTGITLEHVEIDGHPSADWSIDAALVNVGTANVELIRPVSGAVDMYRDAVRPGAPATFHHLGVEVDDFDCVDELVRELGRPWALRARMPGFARFGYVDLCRELGHHVEFVELEEDGRAYFAALAHGSD